MQVVWSLKKFNETGTGCIQEGSTQTSGPSFEAVEFGGGIVSTWHVGLSAQGDVERVSTALRKPVWFTRHGDRFIEKELTA